eukprot:SAG11_NODE_29592_length_309_cov_0.957143_2_plen_26_part_01
MGFHVAVLRLIMCVRSSRGKGTGRGR